MNDGADVNLQDWWRTKSLEYSSYLLIVLAKERKETVKLL